MTRFIQFSLLVTATAFVCETVQWFRPTGYWNAAYFSWSMISGAAVWCLAFGVGK